MECHHPRSSRLNLSAKGVTATVLGRRDAQGVILVHMPRGQTINSDLYNPTLKILQKHFRMVGPHRNVAVMFLQLQRTRPHISLKTQEAIAKTRNVLLHPPHSPDLAPSDVHFSAALQNAIRGKTFERDDEVAEGVAERTKFKLAQEGDICSCLSLVKALGVHEKYAVK